MPITMRVATVTLAVLLAGCAATGAPGSPSEQSSTAATGSPTSPQGAFGAVDLPRIVLSEAHLKPGWTLDDLVTGFEALMQPVLLLEHTVLGEQPGFVDARMTRIGTSGQESYWEEGGYVTWTAVYETAADAQGAFKVLIEEHEADSGWGMEQAGRPPQGDDSVTLQGPAYGFDENLLNVWRIDNLLLAGLAIGATAGRDDTVEQLDSITQGMVTRANESP